MPFPTSYTRIPYISDEPPDIQLDRQRGHVWVLSGGGYSYHDEQWETKDDGPNFFKIDMATGQVLTYGRGPLPPWNIEDLTTDNSLKSHTWAFAIAPSTGNLYAEVYNSYTATGRILCLDPNDFHVLFQSPPFTGLYRATDWITIVEPYVYYYSYIPGGTPAQRLAVSRLPLTLTQVDWNALTYSGISSFEIPIDGNIAVDSAGNVWSGCLKTLAKVSPTGVVTSYNLTASLNVNACIMTVGYDPGTNSLGLYVNLRSSNGTGAFVSPYMQIVKVNCATGAVTATFSPPTNLRFRNRPLHRAWENIYEGRVLLQLDKGTINAEANRGALLDFDLRSMAILRIYRLAQDWALDPTPVEPYYGESPLLTARAVQNIIPDFASRTIWAYNAWQGWIYPDGDHPQGSYGVWSWALNQCARYIPIATTSSSDGRMIAFDRQRGVVWVFTTEGPTLYKIRTSDGTILLQGRGDMPPFEGPDAEPLSWIPQAMGLSPTSGDLYLQDSSESPERIRRLSGGSLALIATSPFMPSPFGYIQYLTVIDPYVYVYLAQLGEFYPRAVARLPLDLSRIDWVADLTDPNEVQDQGLYTGLVVHDGEGRAWTAMGGTMLFQITSAGLVNRYDIAVQLPASHYIVSMGYDAVSNSFALLLEDGMTSRGAIARFSLATLAVNAVVFPYQNLSGWGRGGSEPTNWGRIINGRVWLRLNHNQVTSTPALSSFEEFDIPSMTPVRQFNLISDWCITGTATNQPQYVARRAWGYIWDDCACCLWLYNDFRRIYPDAGSTMGYYGVWKLPLPDEPAADCPLGIPARTPPNWLEYFHDALLDTYISYDCKIAVKFQTYITRMREGHEERIGEWQDPIWTFDITPALRDQADLDYLLAFFRARHGPQFIFKFFSPLDNTVENEVFAVGDGVAYEFQLSRRYHTGIAGDDYYYVRPIVLPIAGIQVFDNGVLIPPNTYNFYALGGTIVLANPPAAGHQLTWTGSYYTPVRFLNNRVYSIVEHYEQFEDKIMLVEERVPVQGTILDEAESPDFLDVLFPYRYAQRASMGPEIDVVTVQSDSGATFRKAQFKTAKIRFTVEETEQPMQIIQQILAFFLNRKGRLISFRARDITDFQLTKEPMQAADGTRTQFQVVKNYVSGEQTDVRPITKPNADLVVYDGNLKLSPQPSVDTSSGTVTFATPPAAEAQLNCSGTFDVPVRFDSDEMMFSIKGYEWFNMEAMNLVETELGLPNFTLDTPPPVLRTAGPAPKSAAQQILCDLPPRPAVTQYLEFRGASGAGLQVETPGSLYRLFAGASSLTFAVLVSHVKTGTLSGAQGAVYPMALFSHVMPGMGTDPALLASTGFTLYLQNLGAGIALDASIGAYTYSTEGALCTPELALTPRVPAQGAIGASPISGNDHMHAYVVTMDWVSRQAYWSGTLYGSQSFTPEAFAYTVCVPGAGGTDAQLVPLTANTYVGVLDASIGAGYTINDGWLGTVSAQPQVPAFHSPLTAFMYEHLLLPTFGRIDMRSILRDVHAPILQYWGSKYGTGFPNAQSPALPTFDIFWWRADENVTIADAGSGAVAQWAPVACGFDWVKPGGGSTGDVGQPRQHAVQAPAVFDDVLMLADGRRLLARQT